MPTIVATDTDAEGEDSMTSGNNPFVSTEDGRPAGLTTIHKGRLDKDHWKQIAARASAQTPTCMGI